MNEVSINCENLKKDQKSGYIIVEWVKKALVGIGTAALRAQFTIFRVAL